MFSTPMIDAVAENYGDYPEWHVPQILEPMIDFIAARCGWKPLEIGESMIINEDGKVFKITRMEVK